jgi:hypothetical protein
MLDRHPKDRRHPGGQQSGLYVEAAGVAHWRRHGGSYGRGKQGFDHSHGSMIEAKRVQIVALPFQVANHPGLACRCGCCRFAHCGIAACSQDLLHSIVPRIGDEDVLASVHGHVVRSAEAAAQRPPALR